jgi:hypothetical protein
MKKTILILMLVIIRTANAQVVSIFPNQEYRGHILTTTITMANGVLQMASPPLNINDIYLQQGTDIIYSTAFTLYPSWPSIADSISATFDIPSIAALGLYDVHVTTYQNWGFPPPTPVDNLLAGGFTVLSTTGLTEKAESFATSVYPNPVNDASVLFVPPSSNFELCIYDAEGREVIRKNIAGNYPLLKNKFIPGVYHYCLKGKNGNIVYSGKFVVID